MQAMKVLVADDEKELTYALAAILQKSHFAVDISSDGESALFLASQNAYDCLILDIMMPGLDGYGVLRELRAKGIDTPVIFLTAKGAVEDRVKGLDSGADDYLSKPFDSAELIARIYAVTRRHAHKTGNVLTFDDLSLDLASGTLSSPSGSASLSNKEIQIMSLFFLHPERKYGSEAILNAISDGYSATDTGTVWVYLSELRKLLRSLGSSVRISLTRGVGYRLEKENDV